MPWTPASAPARLSSACRPPAVNSRGLSCLLQITPQFTGFIQRLIIARDAEGQGFRPGSLDGARLHFTRCWPGSLLGWRVRVASSRLWGLSLEHICPPPTASPCVHVVSFSSRLSGARRPEQTRGCQAVHGEAQAGSVSLQHIQPSKCPKAGQDSRERTSRDGRRAWHSGKGPTATCAGRPPCGLLMSPRSSSAVDTGLKPGWAPSR